MDIILNLRIIANTWPYSRTHLKSTASHFNLSAWHSFILHAFKNVKVFKKDVCVYALGFTLFQTIVENWTNLGGSGFAILKILAKRLTIDCIIWWLSIRRACGFQNLVWTPVWGGHNLPPMVEIGLRWLPKLGVDMSPRPHAHRRACYYHG